MPQQVLSIEGWIHGQSEVQIVIPFHQIQTNFESETSDRPLHYSTPSSFVQYLPEGGRVYSKFFNNYNFKAKNYDTTGVFAILSIYLVLLVFLFSGVPNLY